MQNGEMSRRMNFELQKAQLKTELDAKPQYRELLFRRGYLLTDRIFGEQDEYPFYGLWNRTQAGRFNLYVQQKQTMYKMTTGAITVVIVGHAYNPFDRKYQEEELCKDLLTAYQKGGLTGYFDKVSELTGLHVIFLFDGEEIIACQDACSLTGCYFGIIEGHIYISEHPQLVADLLDLKMDAKVMKLVQSKCYNIGNRHLPGNLTPYPELKRLGANTYMYFDGETCAIKRFYPVAPHAEFRTDAEKQENIRRIGELIHNGIFCCTKKWDRCAISLSGGTDSKTTLACANGLYDKFAYFSFHSKPQELVDAEGAKKICDALGLEHKLYHIPETNAEIRDFPLLKNILQHNTNYIKNLADNEIRKYVYLHDIDAYDIELKSWASEVTRVFLERKYQLKMPEVLNERHFSIFQTRYFGHPSLLKWSDNVYFNFMKEIGLDRPLYNFEHSDLFYWEVRMGAWGVGVTSSQQFHHRVTMPMNNRKLLEIFLSFPHEERKTDSVHKRVMAYMNPAVVEAKIEIPNLYFHSYRQWMEKMFYRFRTLFYRPKK